MPRLFLSLYADSHDAAIEFYCETIGLFTVAVDKKLPTVRNVVLNYTGASIPLSLAVVVTQRGGQTELIRRVFSLALFDPNPSLTRDRLVAAGFAAELQYVPLGMELTTEDPFGNTLYLTDKTYDSYEIED